MRRGLWLGLLSLAACVNILAAEVFQPMDLSMPLTRYRTKGKASEPFQPYPMEITRAREGAVDLYRIAAGNIVALLRAGDLRPLRVEMLAEGGSPGGAIEYGADSVCLDWSGKEQRVKIKGVCYDCNTLFQLFRAFPFGRREEIVVPIFMDGQNGRPIGIYQLYARELAREMLTVPAGVFEAYKLEMGVPGVAGFFAAKYKYYFWYTADKPHYFLKYYEKSTGGLTELAGPLPGRS